MVDPRAAEFCRAGCAQHSPAVFLPSVPEFWRREGKRENDKDHKFQMICWIFRCNLSLHECLWGFLFTSNSNTDLVSMKISVAGRLLAPCSPPSFSVSPCLPDLTRNVLFFWQPIGPNQGTLNQMPFQLTVHFPLVAMWLIKRAFLQYISQIYFGITKQKIFPA